MTIAAVLPSRARPSGLDRVAVRAVLGAILALALVLRLWGATGDLWLDEIWSLELVGKITSIDQVFWRINHDNNHFLNSAYLYLVGPDAPPLVHRALAIALGVGGVLAAALVTADRGPATQVLAALLFTVSYPLVHYGSEARGYSGLVLFTLLGIFCLERILDRRGSKAALAAVIFLGFLSHVTMAAAVVVLVAWAAWTMLRRGDGPVRAGLATVTTFLPALLALLPLAACVIYGAATLGLTLGGSTPFTLDRFVAGYGGMIRHLFGLPLWLPDWLPVLSAAALVGLSAWKWPNRRASLYVIGIVGLPVLMAQLRLPNLEFPRYFLVSGVLLLLCTAEVLGRGLETAGWARRLAACGVAAMLIANAFSLSAFLGAGRGSYAAIVDRMTSDGPANYASSNEFRTPKIVRFFAARLDREARLVPAGEWCAKRPAWLIVEVKGSLPPDSESAPGCGLIYDLAETTESWGLSGGAWALYRKRADQVLSALDALRLTPVMRHTPSG